MSQRKGRYFVLLPRYFLLVPKYFLLVPSKSTKILLFVELKLVYNLKVEMQGRFFLLQHVLKWIKRGLKFPLFLFVFEGKNKHLKALVYKENITQSIEDCKNLCVEDACCRSINYRGSPPSGEENICELFHTVNEKSWELENEPPGYEHHKLNPYRVRTNKTFYIIF